MRSKNITNILLRKEVDFVAPLCCYWVNYNITTDSGDKVQTPTYLPHRHRLYHYASYHEIVHGRVANIDAFCGCTHAPIPCSKICFFAIKSNTLSVGNVWFCSVHTNYSGMHPAANVKHCEKSSLYTVQFRHGTYIQGCWKEHPYRGIIDGVNNSFGLPSPFIILLHPLKNSSGGTSLRLSFVKEWIFPRNPKYRKHSRVPRLVFSSV